MWFLFCLFSCDYMGGMVLASSRQGSGVLLYILQCRTGPHKTGNSWSQVVMVSSLRNPDINRLPTPVSDVIWRSSLCFDVLTLLSPFLLSHLKNSLFCKTMNSLELSVFLSCVLCQAESVPACVEELMV